MSLITRIFRGRRLDNAASLRQFMGKQSAFISQKCTVEYCRARSGLNWTLLFKERAFVAAMEVSRWEAYGAIMTDVAAMLEAKLRASTPPPARDDLVTALVEMMRWNLNYFPIPAHRHETGWEEVLDAATVRLRDGQLAPPLPVHEIGLGSSQRVFDTLPIHPRLRGHDYELIQNNIRFNLCRAAEDFEHEADAAALIADLALGKPPRPIG